MNEKKMNAAEYKTMREKVGSQSYVAERLGICKMTVSSRERGAYDGSKEAELALLHLFNFSRSTSIDLRNAG